MKRLQLLSASFAVSALCASFLPMSVSAQSVDSFFDIFTEVDLQLPDVQCDPCEALRREIAEKQNKVSALQADIETLTTHVTTLDATIQAAENQLAEDIEALEEMQNPQNYVESDGRRYDSSDHAAMKRRSANLWGSYKSGSMTAQEYSDELAKPYNDPDVQKELEKLKKEIEKELTKKIADGKKDIKDMQEDKTLAEQNMDKIAKEIDALLTEIEKLLDQLEDCEKRCAVGPVNLPEDYGIGPNEKGFWERIFGWFGGEDDTDEVLTVPQPSEPESFFDLPNIPMDLKKLGLQSEEPRLIDSFFDVFTQVDLPPPVCHLCDPIRSDLAEAKEDLAEAKVDLAEAQQEKATTQTQLDNLRTQRQRMRDSLNAFNNPGDYVEDDQGRRYDSSDNAAMRERNARLWAGYKAGNMSASQLEAEWSKSFHDPDVQAELEKIKQEMREAMEDALEDLDDDVEDLEEDILDLDDEIRDLEAEAKDLEAEIEALQKKLADCEKLCVEKKDVEPKVLLPDFSDLIFEDGFESGDTSTWKDHRYVDPNPEVMEEASSSAKVSEDREEEEIEIKQEGLLCRVFGWFCKDDKQNYEFKDLVQCAEVYGPECDVFDYNNDNKVDDADLKDVEFSLIGLKGFSVPLELNGLDGNDSLSVNDLAPASTCLLENRNCDDILFGDPPPDVLLRTPSDTLQGVTGNDFQIQMSNGNDLLLGSPGKDLIQGGGTDDLLRDPLSPDAFGPDGFVDGDSIFSGNTGLPMPFDALPPVPSGFNDFGRCMNGNEGPNCAAPDIQAIRLQLKLQPGESARCSVTIIRIGNRRIVIVKCVKASAKDTVVVDPTEDFVGANASSEDREEDYEDEEAEDEDEIVVCDDSTYGAGEDARAACNESCSNGKCTEVPALKGGGYCWQCAPKELVKDCTDISHNNIPYSNTKADCQRTCDGKCSEVSSASVGRVCYECVPESCPAGTFFQGSSFDCEDKCSGTCKKTTNLSNGSACYSCEPAKEQCDAPTQTEGACVSSCNGTCTKSYTRNDGVKCYSCVENAIPTCGDGAIDTVEQCDDGNISDGDGCDKYCMIEKDNRKDCPSGTTASYQNCNEICSEEGGECVDTGNGCYSCQVLNCPSGTYKNECPSSCSDGCDVAAKQGNTTCYTCKQSCDDICTQQGYGPASTDHSAAILGELNGYSCVSGASITIQTATIGSCNCIGDYSVSVDTTPPVCAGTPCGNVTCGESTQCQDGDTTITVNCNWGGWEQIQKHQFRPVFGS